MGFIQSQLIEIGKLSYPSTSYSGQSIVITGSNTGPGKEAGRHYARLGTKRLILAIDMAQPSSIKAFATRLESELDRVDIFHANAGLVSASYKEVQGFGAKGVKMNIAINYIPTNLLVALVLPKLKATFPQKSKSNLLEAVKNNREHSPYWKEQYPLSKLLGVFAIRSIAEEYPSYPVTINAVSPGLYHSDLSREAKGLQKVAFGLVKTMLARTTEQGSGTLVSAGIAGLESHGQYLEDCKVAEPSEVATQNPDVGKCFWAELKAKLEEIQPGVTNNF
ncbi:NAD(P)-binding protein [Xylaria bambusicola]|uniref:NAD(P)-binding protein n=1 Tax=Xylaria bambusicola TaxID=326684 RepID=UPI0020089774|nr:NAD(P)-binding protein [Xylaria bambusicola]KAI0505890.1 NAD(P)-binding protein [Xylaria bambusicola]